MDNLRLILIITGVCIVLGIYLWDRRQSRKHSRRHTVSASFTAPRNVSDMVIAPRADDSEESVEDYDGFFIDTEPDLEEDGPGEIFISRDPTVEPRRRPISESRVPQQSDAFDSTPEDKGNNIKPDSVITLFIVVNEDRTLSGKDIQTALTALGFEFGEMNIFHHFGTADLASNQPLFSLVNMYEPGYFDIERMDQFSTRGLSVFTRLPMHHNAEIVFPYMLEITRRLASRLGAGILGPDRMPLDQAAINVINQRISEYAG
jgi:cell division protein ZipA